MYELSYFKFKIKQYSPFFLTIIVADFTTDVLMYMSLRSFNFAEVDIISHTDLYCDKFVTISWSGILLIFDHFCVLLCTATSSISKHGRDICSQVSLDVRSGSLLHFK